MIEKTGVSVGFTGLLAILFIVFKLMNIITWSWWWVLSPIWISWVVGFVLLAVIGIYVLFTE